MKSIITGFKITGLLFRNWLGAVTIREYFISIFIHIPLNIVLITCLFTYPQSMKALWQQIDHHQPYFVGLYGFLSGAMFFEVELFAEVLVGTIVRKWAFLEARLLMSMGYGLTVWAGFIVWDLWRGEIYQAGLLMLSFLTYALLGTGCSLLWGLYNEKNLNNVINLIVWALAGVSSFVIADRYNILFSKAISPHHWPFDLCRLVVIMGIELFLYSRCFQAKRKPQYRR